MSTYDDDVFGEECYGIFEEHDVVKDNSVNKIKTKGIGKTKIKLNSGKIFDIEKIPEKVKLSKEEIYGAKMAEKKRKKEEAIAISKAAVALREKEATDLKLIEDAKSSEIKSKAEQAEQEDDDNWETKSF